MNDSWYYNYIKMEQQKWIKEALQIDHDFLSFVISDSGKGVFEDCEYEDIEDKDLKNEDEFYLEEEDVRVQEAKPFNSLINVGPSQRPPHNKIRPQLQIQQYRFVNGFNQGKGTVMLIQGQICRAIGTNIFLNKQIYFAHNYEITMLHFDRNLKILYSGSSGRVPEIIRWKYSDGKLQKIDLISLPSKSIGVNSMTVNGKYLLALSRMTLHTSSYAYLIDLSTKKRLAEMKIGKVIYDEADEKNFMVINQEGLQTIDFEQQGQSYHLFMKLQHQSSILTALCISENRKFLLTGNRNGEINILIDFKLLPKKCSNAHQSWVLKIQRLKIQQKYQIFVSGAADKKLCLVSVNTDDQSVCVLQTILLGAMTKNISVQGTNILSGLRNGTIKIYKLENNQLNSNELELDKLGSLIGQTFGSNVIFERYQQKYMYVNERQIYSFAVSEDFQIKKIEIYKVSEPVRLFAVHGTMIVYVAQDEQAKSNKIKKQIQQILIEDYHSSSKIANFEFYEESAVTQMKFNQEGDRLALGLQDGSILIVNTNQKTNFCLCASSKKIKNHNFQILDLIWSLDGQHIKSCSKDNLLFYQFEYESKEKYKLIIPPISKMKEVLWVEPGRFSWQNNLVWKKQNMTEQVNILRHLNQYIFVSMNNGELLVYSRGNSDALLLHRWFYGPFELIITSGLNQSIGVILFRKGQLIILKLVERFGKQ